ncbi:MAG: hypothetical protein KatS3mg107_0105 [Gemmataceae bacterium]|nr:MAG: hypothetical protein KatS3mg107_0105 [Gemmataceae bacterium]
MTWLLGRGYSGVIPPLPITGESSNSLFQDGSGSEEDQTLKYLAWG